MTTPIDTLAQDIADTWSRFALMGRSATSPHAYVYASAWRPCDRRMVLEMTVPDQQPPWSAEQLARFRRGSDRERDLLADLSRIGRDASQPFTVVGSQERFTLGDRRGRPVISGKVDAQILIAGTTQRIPVEVKAWAASTVDRIETFEDLFGSPWTRSGAYQLLCYLYGASVPYGLLILDRSGLPKLIPVTLDDHLDKVESFLSRATAAVDHVEAGTLPDYSTDADECRRCPFFGATCNPPTSTPGAQVLADPELEALLEQREAVKDAGREYERLDKQVKAALRGVESGVAGRFLIEGKWGAQTRVELPPDVKAQYLVHEPRGRFTLSITRVPS